MRRIKKILIPALLTAVLITASACGNSVSDLSGQSDSTTDSFEGTVGTETDSGTDILAGNESEETSSEDATEENIEKSDVTTTEVAEPTTEKRTETTAAEKRTEATTEKRIEATTEATTERRVEATTEATTARRTEATTERRTEATTERRTEATTEATTEVVAACEHEWLPVLSTVNHPEKSHTEKRTYRIDTGEDVTGQPIVGFRDGSGSVKEGVVSGHYTAYTCRCGEVFNTKAEYTDHFNWISANDHDNLPYHGTVSTSTEYTYAEVETREVKVVDEEEWTEDVILGFECIHCHEFRTYESYGDAKPVFNFKVGIKACVVVR